MTVAAKPWPFTATDYEAMATIGILYEDDRLELIDGGLVDLAGKHVERYRSPAGDGYAEMVTLGSRETVTPRAFPDVAIEVDRQVVRPLQRD